MNFEKHPSDFNNASPNYLKEIIQWFGVIIVALVIALLIRGFVFELVTVQGPSMEDTMFTGQRLVVYKLGTSHSAPQKGDIIVFKYKEGTRDSSPLFRRIPILKDIFPAPDEVDYIKRVVALPGDEIYIKDGFVFVNGEQIDEPYVKGKTYTRDGQFFIQPTLVPENKLVALGDNRLESKDSREIGFIEIDKIRGKAVLRVWPLSEFGSLYKEEE